MRTTFWNNREDVAEKLEEFHGWAPDDELRTWRKNGACWAVTNDAGDSGVDAPGGMYSVPFDSGVPAHVIVAACEAVAAACQQNGTRHEGGGEDREAPGRPPRRPGAQEAGRAGLLMPSPLPKPLQRIRDRDADRLPRDGAFAPMRHRVAFQWGDTDLAFFDALGPMLVPSVGQQIMLHGVPLVVTGVEPVYELLDADLEPVVYVAVTVELPAQR